MRISALLPRLFLACAAPAVPAPTSPVAETPALPREASVKPGINDAWRSDDIDPLVGRLESESREIWTHRARIIQVVDDGFELVGEHRIEELRENYVLRFRKPLQ